MKPRVRPIRWDGIPRAGVGLIVAVLLLGTAMGLDAADRLHLVKRGDTLYGVAQQYGVSISALAERNGLKPTSWLRIGQKISIPSASPSSRGPKPTLPAEVKQVIDSVRVTSGRWKRIVIHHSGTAEATVRGMNDYHLRVRHMEHGLAYHFVIGNGHGMDDGEIYVGNRWKKQLNGGHLASEAQNANSLGICLVGNFDLRPPTSRQMKSLTALVEALQHRCRLSDKAVVTHQEINVIYTRCPGKRFPLKSLRDELAR